MIAAVIASLVLWPLYLSLSLALDAIGLVLIAPLSLLHAWRPRYTRMYADSRVVTAWRGGWLTWLWGNEEDGVAGPDWWRMRTGAVAGSSWWTQALSAYRWSALRNPSNNLRFIPFINPVIVPARIGATHSKGNLLWSFVWQFPYAGFIAFPRIKGHVFRFWLGWKLKASDAYGVPANDMRAPRCGWATQFKRIG